MIRLSITIELMSEKAADARINSSIYIIKIIIQFFEENHETVFQIRFTCNGKQFISSN